VGESFVDLSQPSSGMALRFENIRREILEKLSPLWNSPSKSLQLFDW
jgi:hypothetical protein